MAISENLQPFTGNGDVSKWVKIFRVGRKTPNKQTNKKINKYYKLIETIII